MLQDPTTTTRLVPLALVKTESLGVVWWADPRSGMWRRLLSLAEDLSCGGQYALWVLTRLATTMPD